MIIDAKKMMITIAVGAFTFGSYVGEIQESNAQVLKSVSENLDKIKASSARQDHFDESLIVLREKVAVLQGRAMIALNNQE